MKSRRRLLRVLLVLLAGAALVFAAGWLMASLLAGSRPARITVSDIEVADPLTAVADARTLIAANAVHRGAVDRQFKPRQLPHSLRLPGLRYAVVFTDHLDLVLARNTGASVGARIWALEHRPNRDLPTAYRDIYFYRFDHKQAESADNVR